MKLIHPNEDLLSRIGIHWGFKVFDPSGRQIDEFDQHNLAPLQARTFMLNLALNLVSAVPTWYFSIFEGDYTPDEDTTAGNLPGLATEITAYTPSTRPAFVPGAVSEAAASNAASLGEFTFTAQKTVRVIALTSASAKTSTSGVLLSVARLPSPRTYEVGSKLLAFGGPSVLSAD